MFMDPPRHTKLRAIISRAFTPRSIAALEPRVRELARGLIDACLAKDVVDVEAELAAPLPIMVIGEMLGLPTSEWPRIQRWSHAIMNLADTILGTPADGADASAAFQRVNVEMAEYLATQVAALGRGSSHGLPGRAWVSVSDEGRRTRRFTPGCGRTRSARVAL